MCINWVLLIKDCIITIILTHCSNRRVIYTLYDMRWSAVLPVSGAGLSSGLKLFPGLVNVLFVFWCWRPVQPWMRADIWVAVMFPASQWFSGRDSGLPKRWTPLPPQQELEECSVSHQSKNCIYVLLQRSFRTAATSYELAVSLAESSVTCKTRNTVSWFQVIASSCSLSIQTHMLCSS